jgi:predicted GNAT family acetyltransferase
MTIFADVGSVRSLSAMDLPAVEALLETDPVTHCFVASRVRAGGLDPWRLGGELLGHFTTTGLSSMLYCGANLVPVCTDDAAREAFAQRLRLSGRRSSSIVGPRHEVLDLWQRLRSRWGRAREIREVQPVLAMSTQARREPDPQVRLSRGEDLDILVPACVAMFTAEVGVSPVSGGMGAAYRARIGELVEQGRSFIRREDDVVVFKAEVGAASAHACQVQGVWVDPGRRGQGISAPAMAAVVEMARRTIAPTVSLYVNDYNVAARRCYEDVGFRQHGEFATVLF